ncbi:MAG: transcriptional regulator [Alphaproteobacteria bacterium]|nr:transcriptional regulator [Alphaproteobacteria bacterium]
MNTAKLTLTIPEFCQQANISRSLFYKSISEGWAPTTIKAGRRTLIPTQSAHDWIEKLIERSAKGGM